MSTWGGCLDGRSGSRTRRRLEMYACSELMALGGGSSPHNWSMTRSTATTRLALTSSTASSDCSLWVPRARRPPGPTTSMDPRMRYSIGTALPPQRRVDGIGASRSQLLFKDTGARWAPRRSERTAMNAQLQPDSTGAPQHRSRRSLLAVALGLVIAL